jgi:HK97 family phage prohead protease
MSIERKQLSISEIEFSEKGAKGGPGSARFYLSTFDNWDRVRPVPERPTKGAFTKHLPAFLKDGFIAIGHDHDSLPVGIPTNAGEDDHGLWIEMDFHSTEEAQKARTVIQERIAAGKSVATSMGYVVHDDAFEDIDEKALNAEGITKGRLLTEIELLEGSFVNIPANPMAVLTGVKSDGAGDAHGYADRLGAVVDAVGDMIAQTKARMDMREKAGRMLSGTNMEMLATLHGDMVAMHGVWGEHMATLADLLERAKPREDAPEKDIEAEARKAWLEAMHTLASTDALLLGEQ